MKKLHLLLIFLSIILIFLSFFIFTNFPTGYVVESKDIEINLNKKEFFKYETIQIEIIGEILQPIFQNDIVIKKDGLVMPVKFYIDKINNNFYFSYATLNLDKGDYSLEIKIRTKQGIKIYKKTIKIKENNNFYYSSLLSYIKDKIKYLSNKELIYSLMALNGIDENVDKEITNEIIKREKQLNDFEKALILIFAKDNVEWKIIKSKILSYFLTIQDNELGNYTLKIKTNLSLNCNIFNEEYNITNETFIALNRNFTSNLSFSFFCLKIVNDNIINATQDDLNYIEVTLIKEYLGNKKIYKLNKKIENSGFIFEINKEFGGINDDEKLTALVLLGFYKNNVNYYNYSLEWLTKNKKGVIDNIVLAIFNQPEAINYLILNQNFDGSFNKEENFSKAEITCFAYLSPIETKNLIYKWVEENINGMNIKDKAACLSFVFEIENIISIMPGLIKTESGKSFDIYLKNYGLKKINITLSNILLDLNYTTTLEKDQLKKLTIVTPSINYDKPYLYDKIEIIYEKNSYILPIIIFITQIPFTNETKINESESKEIIINQSQKEANETVSFLNVFYIEPDKISEILNKSKTIEIKIKNIANETINYIGISFSPTLADIISIEPSIINSLSPGEEKNIEVNFDLTKAKFSNYFGKINIEGKIKNITYTAEISVDLNISKVSEIKSCYELKGKICKQNEQCKGSLIPTKEGACCLGKCESTTKNKKVIGIVLFILGIIFLALGILVTLRKKPKEKKIEEAIKKIQEKEKLKLKI